MLLRKLINGHLNIIRRFLEMVDNLTPVQLSIMSNRLDSVCREMTNTMLLTARSSVLGVARDFSVSIVTSEDEVLAAAEGFPIHVW